LSSSPAEDSNPGSGSSSGRPYDLLLRGGRVVCAAGGHDAIADVGVRDGVIAAVGAELPGWSPCTLDATDALVLPGLVDTHVHLASDTDGAAGHSMLARAGVTTALDLAGPTTEVMELAASRGAGLTVACVESLTPGAHLPQRPAPDDADRAIAGALEAGAIGIKLHYDSGLDPEQTALAIERGTDAGVWVAVHCGTTATASNMDGMRETLELAAGRPVHVAHVNSYCRGERGDPLVEAIEAAAVLADADGTYSESYLASINGTWAGCVDGVPENRRVGGWLEAAGYPATTDGMRAAIMAGFVAIPLRGADDVTLLTGAEGVAIWEDHGSRIGACLDVNPAASRLHLASARRPDGRFAVDALATDGGGIPRNVTLASGLALVELGALTLADLVRKACLLPALALGLDDRGRLTPGSAADLVVVDPVRRQAVTTVAAGEVVMDRGRVVGSGSRVLTTGAGAAAVRGAGCEPIVIDVASAPVPAGRWAQPAAGTLTVAAT
jgi:cytosine/adenosine deaminase-related metal-dependent hydrolase